MSSVEESDAVPQPPLDAARPGEVAAAVDAATPVNTDPITSATGFHWRSSLRQTFRLLPPPADTDSLRILLDSDGDTDADIHPRLPFSPARSSVGEGAGQPDLRRLRDPRQVAQTLGLLYRDDGKRYHVTDLGVAVRRWIPSLNGKNWPVLGRHAAYALAACQLRNPSKSGYYPEGTEVFPFTFIWRAMLALDGAIHSDELNRAILRTSDQDSLDDAIRRIRRRRETQSALNDLGDETVTGSAKNDRLIPWISLASFGYLFIAPKDSSQYYRLRPGADRLLAGPARARSRHHEFASTADYIRYLSDCASLPKDIR